MTRPDDTLYQRFFRASPGKILVLSPENSEFIAVTDEYLKATMSREDDLAGKTLFEVFPDGTSADGVSTLTHSSHIALSMKSTDIMGIQH